MRQYWRKAIKAIEQTKDFSPFAGLEKTKHERHKTLLKNILRIKNREKRK